MLYFVGMPLGNIEDITIRAIKTLFSSDIILAEDTRSAADILFELKRKYSEIIQPVPKIVSYYKDVEMEKLPQVVMWLKEGKKVSLISEAGMPLISDPGYLLLKYVKNNNIEYDVIPGPTAFTTSLVQSGFPLVNILFIGFMPKKTGELKKKLEQLRITSRIFETLTVTAYESPFRLKKTIELIKEKLPDAKLCICRELTKKHQEIIHEGEISEFLKKEVKGEITLVLSFKNQ